MLRWLLILLSFLSPAYSISIDLDCEEHVITVPVTCGAVSFEINHTQQNTIYIFQFDGPIDHLECDNPQVTLGANNTVLIEREEQEFLEPVILKASPVSNRFQDITVQILTIPANRYPNLGNERWGLFIDRIRNRIKPREATELLVELTIDNPLKKVLTVGCESGEDPLFFAKKGIHVTALDATPHAIGITCLRMAEERLLDKLDSAWICTIEDSDDTLGTFDAVTAGQVFSFVDPHHFAEVMSQKVLSRVGQHGYFSAHFFGKEHTWSHKPKMTFVTEDELQSLFDKNGFDILWINEIKTVDDTIFQHNVFWHDIQVIARKRI